MARIPTSAATSYFILSSDHVLHHPNDVHTYRNIINVNLCISYIREFNSHLLKLGSYDLAGALSRAAFYMRNDCCQKTKHVYQLTTPRGVEIDSNLASVFMSTMGTMGTSEMLNIPSCSH